MACLAGILAVALHGTAQHAIPFACTPLTGNEDLSAKMVTGINAFLIQETERRTSHGHYTGTGTLVLPPRSTGLYLHKELS